MDTLREVLAAVQQGTLGVEEAVSALKWAPYEDLGYARVDTHRKLRTGVPEVVYCAGKTVEQVLGIVERLIERHGHVLCTRASPEQTTALVDRYPQATAHRLASIVEVREAPRPEPPENSPIVLVLISG